MKINVFTKAFKMLSAFGSSPVRLEMPALRCWKP